MSSIKKVIPLSGFAFLIVIVFHLFPVNFFQSYILNSAFENLLHPYGFAVVTVFLLFVLYPSLQQAPRKLLPLFFMSTALFCIAVGLISEITQFFFNRDASFDDLRNDTLGTISGILLFISLIRRSLIVNTLFRTAMLLTGILILVFTSIPFAKAAFAVYSRDNQYPALFGFEKKWEKMFIDTQSSTSTFTDNKLFWPGNTSTHSLKVDLHDGEYPGVAFSDVYSDWSKADSFSFGLYSLSDSLFTLYIRINDSFHNNEYNDRFNAELSVSPGKNQYSFAIDDIAKSLKTRTMKMKQVETVILFGLKSNSGKSFLLDSIRLNR